MINRDTLRAKIDAATTDGMSWQERKHMGWRENWMFYRDRVHTNRITQRQSVNLPLMKQTINTLVSKFQNMPSINFSSLTNDKQSEIYFNAAFESDMELNKMRIKDKIDKKMCLMLGRAFKGINLVNGRITVSVIDAHDILVSRFADPSDLNTSSFLIHNNVFATLGELQGNEFYDQNVVKALITYFSEEAGIVAKSENREALERKNDRMADVGAPSIDDVSVAETVVKMALNYIKIYDDEAKKDIIYLAITAEGLVLSVNKLEDVIGKTRDNWFQTHYPYSTWATDPDQTDFWSDSVADTVRGPNKVLNTFYSQMIENRMHRNFGMNYYNATAAGVAEGFSPPMIQPRPGAWVPVPGNPKEVVQRIDVPDLSESLDEMNFILQMTEQATAATAIMQGKTEQRKITLGEVEMLMDNALDQVSESAEMYLEGWKDFGVLYAKFREAVHDKLKPITAHKKGYRGNMFKAKIHKGMWKGQFDPKVQLAGEKEAKDLRSIEKLNIVRSAMPDNVALKEIYQDKLMSLANLNAEEMKQVQDFEKKKQEQQPSPEQMAAVAQAAQQQALGSQGR